LPAFVITGLLALGGLLPAVGIATLLYQSIRDKSFILFFLLGFVAIVGMQLSIIQLTIVAAVIAYMYFISVKSNKTESEEVL
jgi:PTS system mannose-specific IIC component